MAATVKFFGFNGAGPTGATVDGADSASFKFGRDDLLISTASIPIPTATGTNYSYVKWVGLDVTATSTTALSNLRVSLSATPPAGSAVYFGSATTYTQNNGTPGTAAGNYPASAGTNGATPATVTNIAAWVAVTTTAQVYDASTGLSTGTTGLKGKYCCLVLGVDFTYAGGGGALNLGNAILTYDEQ